MKTKIFILAAALTIAVTSAHAQQAQATPQYCSLLGSVYQTAASARDLGHSPDMALKLTRPYGEVIPEELRIEIVNQMFFDQRFNMARGEAIRVTVRDACMNPRPAYKPLQAKRGAP